MLSACQQKYPEERRKSNVLYSDTGIPKLSKLLNLCDFVSPYVERKWRVVKSTRKPSSKLTKSNVNKKQGPACKLNNYDEFLITLIKCA